MNGRITEIEDAIRDLDEIVLELKKQLAVSRDVSPAQRVSAIGFTVHRRQSTNYGAWASEERRP